MMRMSKTMVKARETLQEAGDTLHDAQATVATGAQESKEAAAELIERVGRGIKGSSAEAAHAVEETGARVGGQLEEHAGQMRGQTLVEERRSLPIRAVRYPVQHPWVSLFLVGVVAAFVALVLVRLLGGSEEEYEFEGYEAERVLGGEPRT